MKKLLCKIWDCIIEHWVRALLSSVGLLVATAFAWFYRTLLENWLIALKNWLGTRHSLELSGAVFVLVFLAVAGLPILLFMLVKKQRYLLTDAKDIKGAIEGWFSGGGYIDYPVEKDKCLFFQTLDDCLSLKKGTSKKYLPIIAPAMGHGIDIGKKTFTLVLLTDENNFVNIIEEYLSSGEDPKEISIPTYDIDNRLLWPKGTTKNSLLVFFELCATYTPAKIKVKHKSNGNVSFREK